MLIKGVESGSQAGRAGVVRVGVVWVVWPHLAPWGVDGEVEEQGSPHGQSGPYHHLVDRG